LGKKKLDELESIAAAHHFLVLGDRSKVQPGPLFMREEIHRTSAEQRTQLRRIQSEALHMQAVREGLLPIVKNPTRDCSWDCDFFNVCELQERGGDYKTTIEVAFKQEDPYADHRKSTDE
jgi:Zierdtviridae exonuclease